MSTTGLGICLGVLGSIAINTGNNLQCLGMHQLEEKNRKQIILDGLNEEEKDCENTECDEKESDKKDEPIDACQSSTWIIGTIVFVSGSLLNFAAFAFAPQSILASLEGIQFVTNVAFGKLVMKKKISRSMYAGTIVTICGVVLTVLSASVVGTLNANFQDLLALWAEVGWLVYISFTFFLGLILQATHQLYLKEKENGTPLAYTVYVLPITYATFSALFGTLSVVFAKILSELLTLQFEGTPIFYGKYCWFTYVTLAGWLALVGVWLYRMNEALSLYDPLFIIPLLQMNFILFAIISGGIYFKEFSQFELINWIGFILGVCLLFTGIYLLSPLESTQIYPEEDYDEAVEMSEVAIVPSSGSPDTPPRGIPSIITTSPPVPHTTPSSPRTPTRTPRRPSTVNTVNPNTLPFYSLIPTSLRMERRPSHEESTLFRTLNNVHSISHVLHAFNAASKVSPLNINRRASSANAHRTQDDSDTVSFNGQMSPDRAVGRPRSQSMNRLDSPEPINSDPIVPMRRIAEVLNFKKSSSDTFSDADKSEKKSLSNSETVSGSKESETVPPVEPPPPATTSSLDNISPTTAPPTWNNRTTIAVKKESDSEGSETLNVPISEYVAQHINHNRSVQF